MGDEFDDDADELFNDDFDDTSTLTGGVRTHMCPNCKTSLDYRVEGRFVVRFCKTCSYEEED